MLDEVIFVLTSPNDALAAPLLGSVRTDIGTLDKAIVRNRNHAAHVGNHVFQLKF